MTGPQRMSPEAFADLARLLPSPRIEASEDGKFQFLMVGRRTVAVTELAPTLADDVAVGK